MLSHRWPELIGEKQRHVGCRSRPLKHQRAARAEHLADQVERRGVHHSRNAVTIVIGIKNVRGAVAICVAAHSRSGVSSSDHPLRTLHTVQHAVQIGVIIIRVGIPHPGVIIKTDRFRIIGNLIVIRVNLARKQTQGQFLPIQQAVSIGIGPGFVQNGGSILVFVSIGQAVTIAILFRFAHRGARQRGKCGSSDGVEHCPGFLLLQRRNIWLPTAGQQFGQRALFFFNLLLVRRLLDCFFVLFQRKGSRFGAAPQWFGQHRGDHQHCYNGITPAPVGVGNQPVEQQEQRPGHASGEGNLCPTRSGGGQVEPTRKLRRKAFGSHQVFTGYAVIGGRNFGFHVLAVGLVWEANLHQHTHQHPIFIDPCLTATIHAHQLIGNAEGHARGQFSRALQFGNHLVAHEAGELRPIQVKRIACHIK